jgi:hypothetical protein
MRTGELSTATGVTGANETGGAPVLERPARRATPLLLWLLNINLGVALGAGLYETRVVLPGWAEAPPASWPNTGLQFWVYVTTVPLTLLTLLNAIAAWRASSPRHHSWLAAVGVLACERVATFSYFMPTMIGLMAEPSTSVDVQDTLGKWTLLNHGRHVLTLGAWLLALRALTRR